MLHSQCCSHRVGVPSLKFGSRCSTSRLTPKSPHTRRSMRLHTRLSVIFSASRLGPNTTSGGNPRMRPNPSLEPTRTGMALGPRGRGSYHRPRGPSATPALAAQLKLQGLPPQKSNTDPAVMHRQAMNHGMCFDSIQWPPSAPSPGCSASKGCGQRNYKRSLMLLWWAADPDERRARGTHSLAEDDRPCLIGSTCPDLLELNGHAPCRSNPDSSTLAARGGGNLSLCCSLLFRGDVQAGSLKSSPRLSTAQHSRAFLASMATTAFHAQRQECGRAMTSSALRSR